SFFTKPGDMNNVPAGLDPMGLRDNGGRTETIALTLGSPAIDKGDPGFTSPPFTDQRFFPRIVNGRIDIGAFELQPNDYRIIAVADFNGDGHPDYVLFNPGTGRTAIWYLN